MRKGSDGGNGKKKGGKNGGETGKKEKRLMKIVATTSFASSRPPERRPLERRTLAPIYEIQHFSCFINMNEYGILWRLNIQMSQYNGQNDTCPRLKAAFYPEYEVKD